MFDNQPNPTASWLESLNRDHVIHPWVCLAEAKRENAAIIVKGEGAYVTDVHGRRMLDGIGGMWAVNIGYGRREVVEAITKQAETLCYFSPFGIIGTPPSIEFAHRIAAHTPGDLNHVFFTTGGSTAVDSAIRFVQFFNNFHGRPDKKHIITREYAYHGSTLLSASVSGKPADRGNMDLIHDRIHHLPAPNPYRRPAGMSLEAFADRCVADLEDKILELGPENVACFIAEPLLASGGVIVPPPGYQRRTWEICRKYDVLYISDEVVTGIRTPRPRLCERGRLRHRAGHHHHRQRPHLRVYPARRLHPLGSALFDPDGDRGPGPILRQWLHLFRPSGRLRRRVGGPRRVGARRYLRPCREVGPYFHAQLETLADLPLVGDVRGSHFMVCLEMVRDRETKEPCPDSWDVAKRIFERCLPMGLMIRPIGNQVVMSPPLILTRDQIDDAVRILRAGISGVQDDLVREGLWG